MARYPKRQKVKRYRRSFYTREMRLKKGIGIAVLVVAVLAAAWVAAPHVLDWATHTWYTVVRDRDLSASSAVSESASSGTQSTAASEPAASSVPEKEPEPEVKGTDIVTGLWAEVDVTTLTDEAAIRSAARQLKAQGMTYAILTLKDTAGQVYYASQTAVGAANAAPTQVELTSVASIFKEEGLVPVAALTAFRDPAGARADQPVVAAEHQSDEGGAQQLLPRRINGTLLGGNVPPEVLFDAQKDSHAGQGDEHQRLERLLGDESRQLRADGRADERAHRRRDGGTQQNLAVAEVFDGGGGKSGAVDDLIRAHREVGGDAGEQIGGQGDKSAAPGDGVHKAAEKHERQDDEIGDRRQLHKNDLFLQISAES